MFKLLTLLGGFSFVSTPVQQVYQTHRHGSTMEKAVDRDEKEKTQIPFGGSGDTVGRKGTINEIAKFDYLVPNWQWFTKLTSESSIGYTDLSGTLGSSGTGLCEYISMAMLLEYQELFVSSGLFTNSEWEKWFNTANNGSKISIPVHLNYKRGGNPENGLIMKLLHSINKTDLKSSKDVFNAFVKILEGKEMLHSVKQAKSASFMHSSSPSDYIKKEHVPVMLSFVSPIAHNITIFGYNSRTNELAFHIGWADWTGEDSMRIVSQSSLWSFWSFGFWNTIYIPQNVTKYPPRKAFKYNNREYSWSELEAMGKDWNDVGFF